MSVLPFLLEAQLLAEDRSVLLKEVPCAVWPAQNQSVSASAVEHDHRGEAPLAHQGVDLTRELAFPNRRLRIADGPRRGTYNIVGSSTHDFLPHIALELRKVGA